MLTIQRGYSWVIQLLGTLFTGPPHPGIWLREVLFQVAPERSQGRNIKVEPLSRGLVGVRCEENLEISNTYTLIAKAVL